MRLDTHVYLVSQQPTPNLTPALDPAVQPRRVILVVSPPMRRRAGWLGEVLEPRGIRIETWPVDDPWSIGHLEDRMLELLAREEEAVAASAIALNATGGTKPMSIAAYEVFRAQSLPIFYIHPERDRLVWLAGSAEPDVTLENRVRLEHFLHAHGARVSRPVERNRPPRRWVAVAEELVGEVERLGRGLSAVNYLATDAKHRGLLRSEPRVRETVAGNREAREVIEVLEREGIGRVANDRLCFPSEEALFFVNGGWLELYLFDLACELRKRQRQIQDLGRSVEVSRAVGNKAVPNELDVALLVENRLHIVECKTRRWRGPGPDGPGAEALYKLDTLCDLLGGLQARALLVSYQDLPPHDRQRAVDLGIHVCAGAQLPRARELLLDWLR